MVHVDGPGPRIVEGGPERQGRAKLAALYLIALAGSIAATAGHHYRCCYSSCNSGHDRDPVLDPGCHCQGTRWSRGRWGRSVVGVERLQGRCGHVGDEREFLQDQVVPDLVEGWEWRSTHDDGSKMIIQLVQLPKNIEDEVAVRDSADEVGQGVSHALHLAIVVAHREYALDEVAEHGVEVKHVRFAGAQSCARLGAW
jgi:hypothetical protein